jgi:hypothetical protein
MIFFKQNNNPKSMRVFNCIVICAALLLASVTQLSAREWLGSKSNSGNSSVASKAAGCSPATNITEFFVNNVRTAAETGGNTWYDRGNGLPYYEIPAGGRNHAIFAGALWMGGLDPAGNLKLAAITFRQRGNDFWPGPLTVDGNAATIAETCSKWDRFYPMTRQMVERHRYYFTLLNQGLDPLEDPLFEDGYQIPAEIVNWPATGDVSLGQSPIIAPFADFRDPETQDVIGTPGLYEPEIGDYPLYDLEQEIDCRTRLVTDPVPLFGDATMYWVFNDNGNIHTESQGQPIGMEIQGQMFAFNTNDEINNMTFCNYVLINRGTLTLNNTFFAQWVDTDLGNSVDDFVGCDVGRGLGYSYNGDDFDDGSQSGPGYGAQPPAIGIDFFEGPYQDADGINNLVGIGPNEALNGLGYLDPTLDPNGPDSILIDNIIDNERFGMRRFVYHSNSGQGAPPPTTDPEIAIEFYNMMRGIWKDGTPMTVGGLGYNPNNPAAVPTDFMFPGTSDPLHWGTNGSDPGFGDPAGWTEETAGNPPDDRRFIQAAGPFTLSPGQFNNITVGVVYARAQTGGAFASVRSLLQADDKAQALFENCFRLLEGPDAPELTFQELDREVILYLRNTNSLSNNQNEEYTELDPTIPPNNIEGDPNDQFYRFQGYKIYQLRNDQVAANDVDNEADSRLVFQCDIKDGIAQIVNFEFDESIGLPVPRERVLGADEGIRHSVQITVDRFASGDSRLVNFKKYYYVAVAYAYNNYEDFNPLPEQLSGQAFPYLRGRSSATGAITPVTVIPHKPAPRNNGTVPVAEYGDGVEMIRFEGTGNGGNLAKLKDVSVNDIMSGPPYKADVLSYENEQGPVRIKVIDPLNVVAADFQLKFYNQTDANGHYVGEFDDARWFMVDLANQEDTIFSERTIRTFNEQIIPEYGISVDIGQFDPPLNAAREPNGTRTALLLDDELTFSGENPGWLSGVPDVDGNTLLNWIRSGTQSAGGDEVGSGSPCFLLPDGSIANVVFNDDQGFDDAQVFENVISGTIAPARLVSAYGCGLSPLSTTARDAVRSGMGALTRVASLDLHFTRNKERWTRAPIFESGWDVDANEGRAGRSVLRRALSVDKNGRNQLDPGANIDEATWFGQQVLTEQMVGTFGSAANEILEDLQQDYPNLTTLVGLSFGMGWFPGFAIDPDTGERLNVAFAENSSLPNENGADMLWNPTARLFNEFTGEIVAGGQHYIYVYANDARLQTNAALAPLRVGMYDGGNFIFNTLFSTNPVTRISSFRGMDWVAFPLLAQGSQYRSLEDGLLPGDARVQINLGRPYEPYATTATALGEASVPFTPVDEFRDLSENNWYPFYQFSTDGLETITNDRTTAVNALSMIDVVPNPYYAYSAYETSRVDNRVKFINLPQECKIQIFTMNGTLIRILEKDNPDTFLEWDLQNEAFIPIAGGMYLVHIQSPGLGERVVKFFAATRPTDLRNF